MRRILVVEYDQNVALTLRDGLERLPDCEVSVAINGEHALQLCEQRPFDVLITDYKMAGMDGLALATRVRELCPQTRVVMVTGYRDDTLWQKPAAALVRSILDKPVGLEEIRSAVSDALGRSEPLVHSGHSRTQEPVARKMSPTRVRQEGSKRRDTTTDLSASTPFSERLCSLGGKAAFSERCQA
jgi:two-component system response regulator FixJ